MSEPSNHPDRDPSPQSARSADGRRPWTTPKVETLRAGDAEVGTQSTQDGAFTTS